MDGIAYLSHSATFDGAGLVAVGGLDLGGLVLAVLALGVLTIVMLSTRRRLQKTRTPIPPPIRERIESMQRERAITRDVDHVMLELDELSRQVHGRLDTKMAKLEAVIRDADQRIAQLERLEREGLTGRRFEVTLDAERPADPPVGATPAEDGRHAEVFELAEQGLTPVDIAQRVGKTAGEIELILALQRTRDSVKSASHAPSA